MTKKIFVAMPAYTGDVCVQTMHSLLFAKEEAAANGWRMAAHHIFTRVADADIGMARNAMLGWFLASDCTDLLFVDTDISWGPGVFTHLMSHGADFVAGAYPVKKDEERYPILWPEHKNMVMDEVSGRPLLEAEGVGMGFTRLSRACVEKLDAAATHHFMDVLVGAENIRCPWVFEFAHVDGQRLSEDYIACRRWRELGGKVWVDASICVDHTGRKTYLGDLCGYMNRQLMDWRIQELRLAHSVA